MASPTGAPSATPWVEEALALVGRKIQDSSRGPLRDSLHGMASSLGVSEPELLERAKARDPSAYGTLISALTVTETYFFRHPEHFELLEREALARRNAGTPFQTAWSVGCATGEEPYSLALALLPFAPRVRVLASDVSPKALLAVRRGLYGSSSFRHVKASSFAHLRPRGEEYEVAPALRDRVVTHEVNLAHDSILPPAAFGPRVDVIFCRNVLLYFAPPLVQRVVHALATCLNEGGLLILGALEAPAVPPPGLDRLAESSASVFRRPPALRTPVPGLPPRSLNATAMLLNASRPALPRRTPQALAVSAREDARHRADAGDLRGALIVLKPYTEDPHALALAAAIHEELDEPREAELAWRRLLLHDPRSVTAHLHLALCARRKGEPQEIERWRSGLSRLVEGRSDSEQVDASGMRVAYVRTVLATLHAEVCPL